MDANEFIKQKREVIDVIMGEFNFDRVVKTMGFLEWTWYFASVPSKEEIQTAAEQLLSHGSRFVCKK